MKHRITGSFLAGFGAVVGSAIYQSILNGIENVDLRSAIIFGFLVTLAVFCVQSDFVREKMGRKKSAS